VPVKPRPPEAPALESLDGEFKVRRATMRGVTYVLRELSAADYEKCLKAATSEDGRSIDNALMFKLMLDKCLVEPKSQGGAIFNKPYPVMRKLNDIVDILHYTPEEVVEEDGEDEDEGEATA
jgi:hypothetical protein